MTTNISSLANLIWSVADLLRGDFKQSQYGRIILPFTVLRRLECVLAPTRDKVLTTAESTKALPELARHKLLLNAAGQSFYNTAKLTLDNLGEKQIGDNLDAYVRGFPVRHSRCSNTLTSPPASICWKMPTCFTRWCVTSPTLTSPRDR